MPALFALIGEISGIFSGFALFYKNFVILFIILPSVLLIAVIKKKYAILIILFFVLSVFMTGLSLRPFTYPTIPANLLKKDVAVKGTVQGFSQNTYKPNSFVISHLYIQGHKFSGRAKVYAEKMPPPYSSIILQGTIYKNNLQNSLQAFTGYSYVIFAKKISVQKSHRLFNFLSDLRNRIEERALLSMKSEEAFLFLSSIAGISSLDATEKLPFRDTGTAHIFAISGLHFGILGKTSYALLRPVTPFASQISFIILLLFLFLIGFRVSALRAFIMYGAGMLAKTTGREPIPINTLCFAALIILLINPTALFSVSFQLSFLAIMALLVIAPLIYKQLPENFISKMFSEVISVQLLLFPVFAYYFHSVSLVSIFSNLLIIPFMYILVPVGVVQLIFIVLNFKLAMLFAPVTNFFFSILFNTVKFFSKLPLASVNIQFKGIFVVLYFITIGFLIFAYNKKKKWKEFVFIPLLLIIMTPFILKPVFCITPLALSSEDGFIIQSGNKTMYITSPTVARTEEKDLYAIQTELKNRGINSIDLMIFDGAFKDKESSSAKLITQGIVKNVVLPASQNELQKEFIRLNKDKTHIVTVSEKSALHFDNMNFHFISDSQGHFALLIAHNKRTFLLLGKGFYTSNLPYADVVYLPKDSAEKNLNKLKFGKIYTY